MKRLWMIFILFGLIIVVSPINAKTIRIEADGWCPYNCNPGTSSPGYMIEIMKVVFKKKAHTIKYTNTLWSRALYRVKSGDIEAVVGVSKREAPNLIFPEEELGFSITVFYTKKGSSWKYTGVESLEQVRIGIQKDYDYGEQIQPYLNKNLKSNKVQVALDGLTIFPLRTNIKKMMSGEIDTIPEDKNVFLYTAKKMEYQDAIRYAGSEKSKFINADNNNVYIAFSPQKKHSKTYAKILTEGIRKLRSSGELQTILEKYGLTDWK